MNLKIKKEILLKHLNYVIKGISNKNIRPILNCIHFDLTSDGLYLESTDNDIAIKTFISKNQIEDEYTCGRFVVYGKYIYEIIRKLPNNLICLEYLLDNKINIYTENSSFYLNCNELSEFPNLDIEYLKNPLILESKVLKNIVQQTSFAASVQESRPTITGINFKILNQVLECIATDSYRLSKKNILYKNEIDDVNIIIPTKNIIELTKMLDDLEQIEIHIFNNKIIFKSSNLIVLSRLINGTYPDVTKLIPTEFLSKIKIPSTDFYNLLDRVSLFSSEEEKNTIKLECNKDTIIVSSNIPEIGNVTEKIKVEKDNDIEFKIAFSSKYMMEAIKALDCDEIEFCFNGEIKPIILKNINDDTLIQLIVPIKTY